MGTVGRAVRTVLNLFHQPSPLSSSSPLLFYCALATITNHWGLTRAAHATSPPNSPPAARCAETSSHLLQARRISLAVTPPAQRTIPFWKPPTSTPIRDSTTIGPRPPKEQEGARRTCRRQEPP